ncbi:hypothetical protein [Butyrivibrio sp. YAB3001]|uniref:hypothetical protein n=1 Tax=Butyrivibrio sp. YAB3001 TaxID=1520812 RepID=UPI0008F62015|nr:hypothetical protein [Butyrivibrio sp. YAB3001]SFB76648.1 hypothetical protein SAMN02910398_00698 [Butyrivibrio sp. YAB3001]
MIRKIKNKKVTIRRIVAVVLFFAIVIGGLKTADFILKDRTDHGVKQCLGMYEQPKDTVDVVMLGSSHVHYGINTAKLWEDYGISAYDYSTAEQPLWISYYYLKEFCKNQKPKVVVLDFFTPAAFQEDHKYKYYYLAESMSGFKFSLNKIQMMIASFDWKKDVWNKYFPAIFGYHDRYDSLEKEDIEKLSYDYANYKGFYPVFQQMAVEDPYVDTSDVVAPSDKSVEYLQKIIDYTYENDIKLYITVVPYKVNAEQVTDQIQDEDGRYNWLVQYVANENAQGKDNVIFDYTLTHLDDIGIDFTSGADIYDPSHLNYYGASKFSAYLGTTLKNLYGTLIQDHREDTRYLSWDLHLKDIKAIVKANGFEWR